MVKRVLSIILGLVTAVVVIMLVEGIGHKMFPVSPVDMNNPEALKAFMENLPTGAIAMVLVAWAVGSFAGGAIASLIDKVNAFRNSVVIGVVILILSIINLITIPSPIWMWAGAIILIIPSAVAGNRIISIIKK